MSSDTAATEAAKPEEPKSLLDRLGAVLPIGLTALAAVFGSMSAGALQQAMYWKSQAAQDQAKSTNQWSYAGFKRDRALMMQTAAAQLRAMSNYATPNFPPGGALPPVKPKKDDPEERAKLEKAQATALSWLQNKDGPPPVTPPKIEDERIIALRTGIEERKPEPELIALAVRVDHHVLNTALDAAEKLNADTDKEWDAPVKAAAELAGYSDDKKPDTAENRTARQAAGYDLEERRYRIESRLNQNTGFLYDVRVVVSSAESDKHRKKSTLLSYAMLVAQIGAVASSLALARKKGGSLWLLAAGVGLVALGFGGYALVPPGLIPF